jgi:hypothetical protein
VGAALWFTGVAGGRAPAVYAVRVSGSIVTRAVVPDHVRDGCRREGGEYRHAVTFRTARPERVSVVGTSLQVALRVDVRDVVGGTIGHRLECPDGRTSSIVLDWRPPQHLAGVYLELRIAGGHLALDGVPDDVSGICFDGRAPANLLPLASVRAQLRMRELADRTLRQVALDRVETGAAESGTCSMTRHVRWRVTLQRIG